MDKNVLPNKNKLTLYIRYLVNNIRTTMIRIRYPWLKINGFVRIPMSTYIWSPHKNISFGHNVQLGKNCFIQTDLTFGNNVLVASNVSFIGRDDHIYNLIGKTIWDSPRGDSYEIIIEDDVWIGHGSIIISGVRLQKGSIIGAGSVVTKNVDSYSIVAGNPARKIKQRFSIEEIAYHEKQIIT